MDFQHSIRWIGVKLPRSVSNQQYAALLHAIFSVVNVAGLAEVSSVVSDEAVTDAVLNAEYDEACVRVVTDQIRGRGRRVVAMPPLNVANANSLVLAGARTHHCGLGVLVCPADRRRC